MKNIFSFLVFMCLSLLLQSQPKSIIREPVFGLSSVHGFKADTEFGIVLPLSLDSVSTRTRSVFVTLALKEIWTAYAFIPDELNTLVRFKYFRSSATGEEFVGYQFDDDDHWSLRRVTSMTSQSSRTAILFLEDPGQTTCFDWMYDPVRKTLSLLYQKKLVWESNIIKIKLPDE